MYTKGCSSCQEVKPCTEFSRNSRSNDGYCYSCKACMNAVSRRWAKNNRARMKFLLRRWSVNNRDKDCIKAAKYAKKNPEKRKAYSLLHTEIRAGRLKRPTCVICGSTSRVEGHHEDYSKPLDVMWLCRKHHRLHHKQKEPISCM